FRAHLARDPSLARHATGWSLRVHLHTQVRLLAQPHRGASSSSSPAAIGARSCRARSRTALGASVRQKKALAYWGVGMESCARSGRTGGGRLARPEASSSSESLWRAILVLGGHDRLSFRVRSVIGNALESGSATGIGRSESFGPRPVGIGCGSGHE